MKMTHLVCFAILFSFSSINFAYAELDIHSVTAAANAEVGLIIDGEIDWIVDGQNSTVSTSPFVLIERAELERENGSCFAELDALVTTNDESLTLSGTARIGGTIAESGPSHHLRNWVTANGFVDIEEGHSYWFSGQRSHDAKVHLWLLNTHTGDDILIQESGGAQDFDHSGPILTPGRYQFQVSLEYLHVSNEISAITKDLSFNLVVHRTGTIASEALSWGNAKSLYR